MKRAHRLLTTILITFGTIGGPTIALTAATKSTACASCPRTTRGRIARSQTAKHRFEVQSGYPHGRHGYVVDHIVPLACGGADDPSNMQWQTIAEAKAKDRIERRGCTR